MNYVDINTLIVELIESGRQATDDELSQIVAYVAQAPFASRLVRPPRWWREALARCGTAVPARVPASEFHLFRRVYLDEQWPPGTTLETYVRDLRQAIRHPKAEIWTYRYYGAPAIGFLAPSHISGTPASTPFIFVAYSPQYGTLITGYQTAGPEKVFNSEAYQDIQRHR
jgi:hypothetical protein